MSVQLRLERDLPAILEDLYLGPSPVYRDDLLAAVTKTRQRPAWSFLERWLPMTDITARTGGLSWVRPRAFTIALLLVALLAAAILAYVGTQSHRLPLPFGPARNGVLVYSLGGDLFVTDPASGASRQIASTASTERKPVVSPDGTRVAFLRGAAGSLADSFDLVVVNIDGTDLRVLSTMAVSDGDPLTWSLDGLSILLTNASDDLVRYDVGGAAPTTVLRFARVQADAFQPPDGKRILFETLTGGRTLSLANPDGTNVTALYTIPAGETTDGCDYGTVRWSPDGRQIAFMRRPAGEQDQCRVFVMRADGTNAHALTTATGNWFETDLRWSPDGTRIAFDRWQKQTDGTFLIQPIGVALATGGSVKPVGPTPVSDGAAFEWSPDGQSIIAVPGTVTAWPPASQMPEAHPTIIDATTGDSVVATWSMNSWPSWQRLAQ